MSRVDGDPRRLRRRTTKDKVVPRWAYDPDAVSHVCPTFGLAGWSTGTKDIFDVPRWPNWPEKCPTYVPRSRSDGPRGRRRRSIFAGVPRLSSVPPGLTGDNAGPRPDRSGSAKDLGGTGRASPGQRDPRPGLRRDNPGRGTSFDGTSRARAEQAMPRLTARHGSPFTVQSSRLEPWERGRPRPQDWPQKVTTRHKN